jgi:hypothetical protein
MHSCSVHDAVTAGGDRDLWEWVFKIMAVSLQIENATKLIIIIIIIALY